MERKYDVFVEKLRRLKTPILVKRACERERTMIAQKYPNLCTLKNHFTAYRNAIKTGLHDHLVKQQGVVDIALKILRLSLEEQREFNHRKETQIYHEMSSLRQLQQPTAYIETAIELLKSSDAYRLGVGMCALTGRRVGEVFATASFQAIDKHHVMFSGQLKTKTATSNPYKIPVLADGTLIKERLQVLRNLTPKMKDLSLDEVHDLVSYRVNRVYKDHFNSFYDAPHKPKDMRAIYAAICYSNVPPNMAKAVFVSRVLGHGENDIQTANSYEDFYL